MYVCTSTHNIHIFYVFKAYLGLLFSQSQSLIVMDAQLFFLCDPALCLLKAIMSLCLSLPLSYSQYLHIERFIYKILAVILLTAA